MRATRVSQHVVNKNEMAEMIVFSVFFLYQGCFLAAVLIPSHLGIVTVFPLASEAYFDAASNM